MAGGTFKEEEKVLAKAKQVLTKADEYDLKTEYKGLLDIYKKLLKTTRRLTRFSDSNEKKLRQVNLKATKQQEELEKAHQSLTQHAELLEEKVGNRTKELVAVQEKLEKLVEMGIGLSRERNLNRFKAMILNGAKELTNADGGALLLRTDDDRLVYELFGIESLDLHFGGSSGREIPFEPVHLRDPETDRPDYYNLLTHAVMTERTVNVTHIRKSSDFDFNSIFKFDKKYKYRSHSYLAVPLKPSHGEVIGLLLLFNARVKGTGRVIAFSREMAGFVEGLASQAAVALVNQQLLKAQENLLDSLIKLVASAIDAKSPYTGGHCERVTILGEMLARVACEAEEGVLAEFDMDDAQWREFRVASWMHDCGKVTTPEYVVDKATKLETFYNRIHEVRTRFEVILRDYTIAHQQKLLGDNEIADADPSALEAKISKLKDDFEFLAECNVGGEYMAPEKVERLQEIAEMTWERQFDDRLGLSSEEMSRLQTIPVQALPAKEKMLADKKEHLVPRPGGDVPYDVEALGLKIKVPDYLYNLGELYNLMLPKGTLTDEERFKIQEHAILTIVMLKQLPFPKNLSQVVDIAGCHHETLIGTGYPRKVPVEKMSVKARILAIADVFEALTAADRPYKKAKTLSEALKIMSFMRKDQHIDPVLFDLLLSSGIFSDYAKRFLRKEQIDDFDISQFMSKAA